MLTNLIFPENTFNLYLDVGLSYNAPHSRQILHNDPFAFIIGIEPNPKNCKSLRSLNLGNRFYLIEAGVSNVLKNSNESLKFYMMEPDSGTSSFLKPNESFTSKGYYVENIVTVPLISLETILDLVPWDKVINNTFTMKSDTQGFEDKVIKSLGPYIEKLKYLQVESTTWGYYDDASELVDIQKILENHMIMVNHEGENAWFVKK